MRLVTCLICKVGLKYKKIIVVKRLQFCAYVRLNVQIFFILNVLEFLVFFVTIKSFYFLVHEYRGSEKFSALHLTWRKVGALKTFAHRKIAYGFLGFFFLNSEI